MQSSATPCTVIGIDPGREKCGIAVVHKQKGILTLAVVPTANLATAVGDLAARYQTSTIILGNGTSHREAKAALEPAASSYTIHIIDEAHTTEQARIRYWTENPPQGLRRLIPLGLQTPPEPVDAYVAAILAERWLAQGRGTY
jgi:RNase H-fold protein (predicted Holliday junction resolvase)